MNAVTNAASMSAATLEQVLGTGNLAALSPKQRVELMVATCQSRGLNPLTRPFRFLSLQGQVVMYATRDCTDQLRKLDGVNVEIISKGAEDDLYVVEVRATDKSGRIDSDMAAVPIGHLKGEARANATMKCLTKAKRRVTLSICGLGLLDESEIMSVPGAQILPDDDLGTVTVAPARPQLEPTSLRDMRPKPVPSRAEIDEILNHDSIPALDPEPKPDRAKMVADRFRERMQGVAAALGIDGPDAAQDAYNGIMGNAGLQAEWARIRDERPELDAEMQDMASEALNAIIEARAAVVDAPA